MDIINVIILGLVEGITEFLPVSSTGHLILASDLLKIAQSDFTKSFEIIIQLGAILSVVVLYWKKFWNLELIKRLIAAFIPTGIIGLGLYKIVKTYLIGNEAIVLWSLFLGGIFLIVFEIYHHHICRPGRSTNVENEESSEISLKQSLVIGLFQSIAIIPGVSRSAATIIGGLWLGLKRTTIVEFSFLLAVPTMLAATSLDLVKNASAFSTSDFGALAIGFIVSFLVALFAIKFFIKFVKTHDFILFGIYRIVVAILFWFLILY